LTIKSHIEEDVNMKTWRERIAEARERGEFTREDYVLVTNLETCMVGETAAVLGERAWDMYPILVDLSISSGWGNRRGPVFAVSFNMFDHAEECLDKIEDTVLQLKREQQS
jgi:hypothetical protein